MNLKETLKLEAINRTKERVVCKTRSRQFFQRLQQEDAFERSKQCMIGGDIFNSAIKYGISTPEIYKTLWES